MSPSIDVKLAFQPGDVVFFRSAVLEHFIAPCTLPRSSFVFFSHSNAENLVQNKNL